MSEPRSGILPPQVLRNLGDKSAPPHCRHLPHPLLCIPLTLSCCVVWSPCRSYEKRKQAALEIEHVVKELRDSHSKHTGDTIRLIVHTLTRDYAHSTQSNQRKGGLIGLAATSIALGDDTPHYLDVLLPPVLKSFNDQESRVRYYGCEALYNIAKVARGSVLSYFNEIFDGLCKLYADTDIDVKNGAQLLDRLIKDLVTESDSFEVEKFIPLLRERIKIRNPFIRQLLVGWISVLDSVPDIRMLDFLPEYLGGLFDMLSDVNKDIRQQAYAALAELLRERVSGGEGDSAGGDVVSMVGILVDQCASKDNFTRLTVLSWLHEFIQLDKGALLPLVSDVLVVVLQCLSDSEKEIRVKAEKVNESLLRLVEAHSTDTQTVNYPQLLARVTAELSNKFVTSRIAALRWINMLVTKSPASSLPHLSSFFPSLLKCLQDSDDAVVRLSLEVLARVSVGSIAGGDGSSGGVVLDSGRFDLVLSSLMQLFASDRRFLEQRGSLIIRQLCELLDAESIYRAVAKWLLTINEKDERRESGQVSGDDEASLSNACEFASLLVQTMSLILLTSSELFELRGRLKHALSSPAGRELFTTLYRSWCHNPVSTFALCLLAQHYRLSSALVGRIAELEVTVGALMQIDTLIQLIESPIFIHLRLALLTPKRHPALVHSLYGLLMLLPQSSAFVSLQGRLASVAPLATAGLDEVVSGGGSGGGNVEDEAEMKRLLDVFVAMQQRHARKRTNLFLGQSLLHRGARVDNGR